MTRAQHAGQTLYVPRPVQVSGSLGLLEVEQHANRIGHTGPVCEDCAGFGSAVTSLGEVHCLTCGGTGHT